MNYFLKKIKIFGFARDNLMPSQKFPLSFKWPIIEDFIRMQHNYHLLIFQICEAIFSVSKQLLIYTKMSLHDDICHLLFIINKDYAIIK